MLLPASHASISEDKISPKIDQSNRLGYLDSIADILERFNLDYKFDNSADELLESFKKEKKILKIGLSEHLILGT